MQYERCKAAISVFVFAVYLLLIGLGFLLMPNVPLKLLGLGQTSEVWIRVMAMLLLILAYYYYSAARAEMTDFMRWTAFARASVIVFLVVFVLLGLSKPALILFGVVDLAAAIWTWLALRAS